MSDEQITRHIAEKMMGLCHHKWRAVVVDAFGVNAGRKRYQCDLCDAFRFIAPINCYNPLTDLNHAFAALDKFCDEYSIAKGKAGYCVSIYGVSIKCRATDKSLARAICLALVEATKED